MTRHQPQLDSPPMGPSTAVQPLPQCLRLGDVTLTLTTSSHSSFAANTVALATQHRGEGSGLSPCGLTRRASRESSIQAFCFVAESAGDGDALAWYYAPLEGYERKKLRVDEAVVRRAVVGGKAAKKMNLYYRLRGSTTFRQLAPAASSPPSAAETAAPSPSATSTPTRQQQPSSSESAATMTPPPAAHDVFFDVTWGTMGSSLALTPPSRGGDAAEAAQQPACVLPVPCRLLTNSSSALTAAASSDYDAASSTVPLALSLHQPEDDAEEDGRLRCWTPTLPTDSSSRRPAADQSAVGSSSGGDGPRRQPTLHAPRRPSLRLHHSGRQPPSGGEASASTSTAYSAAPAVGTLFSHRSGGGALGKLGAGSTHSSRSSCNGMTTDHSALSDTPTDSGRSAPRRPSVRPRLSAPADRPQTPLCLHSGKASPSLTAAQSGYAAVRPSSARAPEDRRTRPALKSVAARLAAEPAPSPPE